jgi:hypothetical protein
MKKLTEEERNVDVVIKTSIMGACLVTASTRSAGSREGEFIYERLGVLLLIDIRVQKSTRVFLKRVQEGSKRGIVVVKLLLLSILYIYPLLDNLSCPVHSCTQYQSTLAMHEATIVGGGKTVHVVFNYLSRSLL